MQLASQKELSVKIVHIMTPNPIRAPKGFKVTYKYIRKLLNKSFCKKYSFTFSDISM